MSAQTATRRQRSGPVVALPTTALIYTRVSTEDQAREGLSLDAQLAACRRYAAERGWMLGQEYQDVLSGRRDDRPEYQQMLTGVRCLRAEGKPIAVVVAALDRFGRRVLERVRSREELKTLGVPVHSIKESGEVSDLVANILASVAQDESERTGARVASIVQHVRRNGWFAAGVAPWGYRWRPAMPDERALGAPRSVLELHPDEHGWVAEAYRRAAGNESVRSLARWVAALPDGARGGRDPSYTALRRVLRSPVYAARQPVGDDPPLGRPVGRWPAIVDDATWGQVQERIDAHGALPRQASGRYLLTGFARCPKCGGRLSGETIVNRRDGRAWRYRCAAFHRGGAAAIADCTFTAHMRKTDAAVLAEVGAVLEVFAALDPETEAELRRAWAALHKPATSSADTLRRIRRHEAESERARRRLKDAAIKLVDGDLDKAGYEAAKEAIEADLREAERQLEQLRPRLAPAERVIPFEEALARVGGWTQALHTADVAAQRAVLADLLQTVTPIRTGYSTYRVKPEWTALGRHLADAAGAAAAGGSSSPQAG